MATYTLKMPYGEFPGQYLPNHWAVDYNPSFAELVDSGRYIKSASNSAIYRMDNGIDLIITGSNLKYASGDGTINGGVITSFKLIERAGGETIQTVTGLKWSGSDFYKTVYRDDPWYTASVVLKGDDVLQGTAGSDELWAFGGNDKLFGGAGGDNLAGGRGADTYDGGTSAGSIDQLTFDDAYNDRVGARGVVVDMAKGTATDPWGFSETFKNIERIKGTQFGDKIYGSANADEFRPLGGNDIIDGRGGIDTIRYDRDYQHGGNKGVKVDLATGKATDGYGDSDKLTNIENAMGSDGNDSLKGNGVANALSGKGGDDKLYGGLGKDLLTGGNGKDVFVFDTKPGAANVDTIVDFNVKDDTIWLDDDVFTKAGKVGDLLSGAFHLGTKAHDGSDRIIYDKSTGKLFYDADGDGSVAAVQIALLGKGLALAASDFDIIA